eukprot:g3377.t1
MLVHSKLELRDALTKVPFSEVRTAIQSFHSILSWMGDRPLPDCQRMGFREDSWLGYAGAVQGSGVGRQV